MLTAQKASPCMSVTGGWGWALFSWLTLSGFAGNFAFHEAVGRQTLAGLCHRRKEPPRPMQLRWLSGADGSAREPTEAQKKKHAETELLPLDGRRPYIKSRYEQPNVRGELSGPCSGRMCWTAGQSIPQRLTSPPQKTRPKRWRIHH